MACKVLGENRAIIKKREYWFGKLSYKFICIFTLLNTKKETMKSEIFNSLGSL